MDKERLSRRGIRPVYENGWDVCYVTMWDGWKMENVEFIFLDFLYENFDICSVYLYPSNKHY